MAERSIPVDLFNPGQVFACLGFLEAAEVLLGDAEGGFDWSDEANVCFHLRARGDADPVRAVLQFLAAAEVRKCLPSGSADLTPVPVDGDEEDDDEGGDAGHTDDTDIVDAFPCKRPDATALPLRLRTATREILLSHWADGSSRNDFKLYSGNRTAQHIARNMLKGTRKKPGKKQTVGDVQTLGVAALWEARSNDLADSPFGVVTTIGGSFNFDARSACTGLSEGFNPDKQKKAKNIAGITASPVVQILAPVAMEHARPKQSRDWAVGYSAWGWIVPPILARAVLGGADLGLPTRKFRFELAHAGKNKIVTCAQRRKPIDDK
jgi:CRISPR-associated protein Csx14